MEIGRFEELVEEAIKELPSSIRKKMDNVAICVEEKPKKADKNRFLLGLYQGVPKSVWGRGFGGNLPDKITIYKEPIERFAGTEKMVKETVKRTVYHEIAHHFGFDERDARKIEKRRKKK